jgi:hypothetical protein
VKIQRITDVLDACCRDTYFSATAQNQTTMITFGPTIATPRIAQKFRK